MKCIQCDDDNNLKDRTANQGRCKNCNHPFAFEPTTMDAKMQFTDGFFAKALADISANDTLYFTPKQLLYLLEKSLSRKAAVAAKSSRIGCGVMVIVIGFVLTLGTGIGFVPAIVGLGIVISGLLKSDRRPQQPQRLTLTNTMVNTWLQQWQRFNPLLAKLLPPPSAAAGLAPAVDDVTAYSFDRVLVCDSVAIAHVTQTVQALRQAARLSA